MVSRLVAEYPIVPIGQMTSEQFIAKLRIIAHLIARTSAITDEEALERLLDATGYDISEENVPSLPIACRINGVNDSIYDISKVKYLLGNNPQMQELHDYVVYHLS